MTTATLIMAYYENRLMLEKQYELIKDLPEDIRALLHLIIVDDGSPTKPAYVDKDLGVASFQLFRMQKDIPWNQDACRNIGAKHAKTEWMLLTDMDHMVPARTWRGLLFNNWERKKVYTFRRVSAPDMTPYKWHPNTWFISKAMYEQIGGYDERLAGLYATDSDFQIRMLAITKAYSPLKLSIIRVPREVVADASTTTYSRERDKPRMSALKKLRGDLRPMRDTFAYDQVFP